MSNENVIVKASFKDCDISDRKKFGNSSCIIPISVGMAVHEGDKLSATIKLINAYFKSCTILVDDSIQRFTLRINEPILSVDEAYLKAVSAGGEWLNRNEQILQRITIPYNVMRWDDWRNHPKFDGAYETVCDLYKTDHAYSSAIHYTIEEFISRYSWRSEQEADSILIFNQCLSYLKEECAVMCLWPTNNYDFEVYPTGRNKAMSATHDKLINPYFPNLLKIVSLRFKKY